VVRTNLIKESGDTVDPQTAAQAKATLDQMLALP